MISSVPKIVMPAHDRMVSIIHRFFFGILYLGLVSSCLKLSPA